MLKWVNPLSSPTPRPAAGAAQELLQAPRLMRLQAGEVAPLAWAFARLRVSDEALFAALAGGRVWKGWGAGLC